VSDSYTYPRLPLFPMFFLLEGKTCVVVGAGAVGQEKILGLLASGARVRVIAPEAAPPVQRLARAKKIEWEARRFRVSDLKGAFLVVAATSTVQVNEVIWRAAQRRGVLCNVVDDPPRCDFFYPAVVRRGALQIAISTGGRSPALAQQVRKDVERYFGPEYAEWVGELGRARHRSRVRVRDIARRRELAHEMVRRGLPSIVAGKQSRKGIVS
jgi:precorrin-2 dehydrogenase/sirohydrochlorin ferrochelatase